MSALESPWAAWKIPKWTRWLGVSLLGAALLVLVARQTNWHDFSTRLRDLLWGPVIMGVAVFYLPWLWRGLRVWMLLGRQSSLGSTVAASCASDFLGWLMPAGTGYLSLPVILSSYLDVRLTWGAKALVAGRLMDMVTLCSIAAVACASAEDVYTPLRVVALPSIALTVLGLALLLWPDQVGRSMLGVFRGLGGNSKGKVGRFLEDLLTIKDTAAFHGLLPDLMVISLLIVVSRIAALWLICVGLRAPMTVGQAAYLWSVTSLLGQLPIHPPCMAGVSDAINAGVFMSIGWSRQQAAEVVLGARVVTMPVLLAVAGSAWAMLVRVSARARREGT